MINREAGVFQTSYRGDMALYTLPPGENRLLGDLRAFAHPAMAPGTGRRWAFHEHCQHDCAGVYWCHWPEYFEWLYGPDFSGARRVHGGGRIHCRHSLEPLRHAVLVWHPGRWLYGGPGGRLVRDSVAPHQGAVSGSGHISSTIDH